MPPFGVLKGNTNASFLNGNAVVALVIKDSSGKVLRLSSQLCSCADAHEAEVIIIDWASKMLEEENWLDLMWSSDDVNLVSEIKIKDEPVAWKSRGFILQTRRRFTRFNWALN